ncbi:ATP-binding cassette domain-containing protein [Micromonospora noduli]|uniref:ATP-binding cassette domain-containing protein n=1 Tax=Micromonospora noduli TaxID=709876 RepID=UPI0011BE47CB|nr:ATP-binding cassette domain-containing protein [Micromonospora noduli]
MSTTTTPVRPSAEQDAGVLSRLFVQWPSILVKASLRRPLKLSDSLTPPRYDHLERVTPVFERAWAARRDHPDGLRRALYQTYRRRFWWAGLIFLAYQTCATVGPLLVRELIAWFEGDGRGPVVEGLLIAAGLAGFYVLDALSHKHQWSEVWKTAHSITALLRTEILRKYLRMDRGARLAHPSGEVITLASSDARRVGRVAFTHMAWAVPLGIAGSCVVLWVLLGWAALVGIVILIAGLWLSHVANERVFALVPAIRDANGVRIGLVGEYLGAMRTLRTHGWEDVAERAVGRERATLNALLVRRQKRLATLYLVNAAAPVLMVMATLVTYAALGNELKAADVFAAIAVLTVLRSQLPELVRYLDMRNEWRVAFGKVTTFLRAPDTAEASTDGDAPAGAVDLDGASFTWPGADADARPVLTGVDLRVAPGELICVLGRVGSGKSALLAALAGALPTVAGTARVGGSAVYLPQRPWIMQGSVVDNIRCFSPDDPDRYAAVVRATALEADLAAMPARDGTAIGERGVNLSGGQRQRIALARAAYEDADVYLFDDPTSAVDDAVAGTILEALFDGVLAGRTRIVATHRLDVARRADRVVVLDGGRVVAAGRFADVAAQMPDLLPAVAAEAATPSDPDGAGLDEVAEEVAAEEEETVRAGQVGSATYRRYLQVLTPGLLAVVLLGLAVGGQAVLGGSSFWLGHWTEHAGQDTLYYAGVFAAIGLLALVLDRGLFSFAFARGVSAGQNLHASMLHRVFRAPLSFFDRNSSGRVLARFSGDMETIDLELPETTMDTLRVAVGLVVPLAALAFTSPLMLVAAPLLLVVYLRWQRLTRASTVEASRLSKQANEPMLALLNEAVDGVTSIEGRNSRVRGYQAAFGERVRVAHHADYTVNALSRHFNLKLDMLGAVVLLTYGVLIVAVGGIGAGLAGVGVSFVYALMEALAMSLMTVQMMDLSLASFERVDDYTRLPVEPTDGRPAPAGWPTAGEVHFENVTLRYAEGGPAALNGVSFDAPAGSKIGIVGRTGSGKSSLFTALLRFVPAEQGRILVDGVDTATLRLADLRAAVEVVPQDPVLLPGTLRDNIDPTGAYPDAAVTAVLTKVGLADRLLGVGGDGLDAALSADGGQLSAGERQLLCLARALLRDAKLVLIDEATSSLDAETDARIQRLLAVDLAGATVLTIAHRRETLAGADRVVTLDGGLVARVTDRDPAGVLAGATNPVGQRAGEPSLGEPVQ